MASTIVDISSNNQQHGDSSILHHIHTGTGNNNNSGLNNNNNNGGGGANGPNSSSANNNNGSTAGGGGGLENAGTAAILARLKELEASNQALAKNLDDVRTDAQYKEEKIKLLSADKRKDMEQMIETAIDTWLNSLTGISEDVRKQFRAGVTRIAEQADMKNAAWEVVCQASALHKTNVNRIDELISTCNQQNETIKSLVGSAPNDPAFASESSRIAGGGTAVTASHLMPPPSLSHGGGSSSSNGGNKRPRTDEGGEANHTGDAWDMFDSMLREHSRATYF